jgi:hypothetical protein
MIGKSIFWVGLAIFTYVAICIGYQVIVYTWPAVPIILGLYAMYWFGNGRV